VTIKVLIADDQVLVRSGFRMILEARDDLEVVGEAGDGEQAIRLAGQTRPDVILMDVRMPGLDGIEATRRLAGGSARILMLTTFDMDEYVYAAMKAGACGFLLKDAPAESLIDAVRGAARGDALLAPAITRRLVDEFVRRPAPGSPGVSVTLAVTSVRACPVPSGFMMPLTSRWRSSSSVPTKAGQPAPRPATLVTTGSSG
jgi:DNA-binding NarL/FixJ family response regulator